LWHIGNSRNLRCAIGIIGHITAQDGDPALLDDANARYQPEQRRFAHTVRTEHTDHASRRNFDRNIVESERLPVAVSDVLDFGYDGTCHQGSFTVSFCGHGTLESVRAKPSPRTPVLTSFWYLPSTFGSICNLTRKISFSRSSAVSTLFGVNWASVATKLIVAGTTYCGNGSQTMRASSPSESLPACAAGKYIVM